MILAHVGDSRAVLCKQGLAVGTSGNRGKGVDHSVPCVCSDAKHDSLFYYRELYDSIGSYTTPLCVYID